MRVLCARCVCKIDRMTTRAISEANDILLAARRHVTLLIYRQPTRPLPSVLRDVRVRKNFNNNTNNKMISDRLHNYE